MSPYGTPVFFTLRSIIWYTFADVSEERAVSTLRLQHSRVVTLKKIDESNNFLVPLDAIFRQRAHPKMPEVSTSRHSTTSQTFVHSSIPL